METLEVAIKGPGGEILPEAIPSVSIVKDGGYCGEEFGEDPALEPDLAFLVRHKLGLGRLAGFITEGQVPYGSMTSQARQKHMARAVLSGLPVVRVGRGAPEGFADGTPIFISGSNPRAIPTTRRPASWRPSRRQSTVTSACSIRIETSQASASSQSGQLKATARQRAS
ncbi:MAG: hypothetical protein E6G75_09250 [Alphaproteobacteria bacterium]|nr:MAG: hypothetical protein E6G75_09250 [Alphaproteobacteria bacterium]